MHDLRSLNSTSVIVLSVEGGEVMLESTKSVSLSRTSIMSPTALKHSSLGGALFSDLRPSRILDWMLSPAADVCGTGAAVAAADAGVAGEDSADAFVSLKYTFLLAPCKEITLWLLLIIRSTN